MHNLRIFMDNLVTGHFHRTVGGNPTQIVSAQIHQHVVLCQLFFICQQLPLQLFILGNGLAPRSGTGHREGGQPPVLQPHQRLRRSAHDLLPVNVHVHHVRGRVGSAQHPVSVQQAALVGAGKLSGNDCLENIALPDVFLRLLHHPAIFFLGHTACEIHLAVCGKHRQRRIAADDPCHGFQLCCRFSVIFQHLIGLHVHHQAYLLPQMIVGNDPVKQHQVVVIEIPAGNGEHRFRVSDHGIGKISHKAAGKGRHPFDPRGTVFLQNSSQHLQRLARFHETLFMIFFNGHLFVFACHPQDRIVSQKGIPAPGFSALHAFQQKIAAADG